MRARSLTEIYNEILHHYELQPHHSTTCACLDKWISELERQIPKSDDKLAIKAEAALANVLGRVMR